MTAAAALLLCGGGGCVGGVRGVDEALVIITGDEVAHPQDAWSRPHQMQPTAAVRHRNLPFRTLTAESRTRIEAQGALDTEPVVPIETTPPPVPDPVVPIPGTTAGPMTSPSPIPSVLCPSPPCPSDDTELTLVPSSGPNNNQQLGTQTVTISGVFFPSDCTKGCVFSTPCDTCEMEVTYYVYFGTATAGCNFQDFNADACKCTPLSGENLLTDCGWTGTPYIHSKFRCKKIVCKVSPLYGTQPLKLFFRDKACKPETDGGEKTCNIYPATASGIDADVQLWPLNFTFDAPLIHSVVPPVLPAEGGVVTVIGRNFGGDSNFIQVYPFILMSPFCFC